MPGIRVEDIAITPFEVITSVIFIYRMLVNVAGDIRQAVCCSPVSRGTETVIAILTSPTSSAHIKPPFLPETDIDEPQTKLMFFPDLFSEMKNKPSKNRAEENSYRKNINFRKDCIYY